MSNYRLTDTNIDIASTCISEFLTAGKVSSRDTLRLRLSLEEVLLKYLEHFGEGKEFFLRTSRRFRTLKIELTVPGDSFDPFASDDGSLVLHNLLSSMGLAPIWRYKNGKNTVTFSAKKNRMSQVLQLGIAIAAALVLGGICLLLPQTVSSFITGSLITPLFNTFMGLLSAICGPIIFLSVVWGICGMGDMTTFGRIGKTMLLRFLLISVLVGAVGVAICALFFPMSTTGGVSFGFSSLYEMILDIIPGNLVAPFLEGNSLQIIFIATLVGLTMLVLGDRVTSVAQFIDHANQIMQYIMGVVCGFIPFFVFGSVLNMVVGHNFGAVASSYKLILVMLLADVLLMAAYLSLVSVRKNVSPLMLLKKMMPTFLIGLTTASSAAAYQTNTQCCRKKLGIDQKIIDIGIPLGQVIFMPGAILLFLAVAFGIAESCAVAITPTWMLTAFIISVVLAIAAPPVPGAALTCYTILFLQLGIPTDAITVVIALNVILEFVTTAANLFCLQAELVELSGSLDALDMEILRK